MAGGNAGGQVLDVAIVGAGVSGVYCGWRLLTDSPGPPPSVAIFELSERVGGRLLSLEPPGLPGVMIELGGMRYMSTQPLVRSLVEDKLGLRTRNFAVEEPANLNYLRGARVRNSQLTDPQLLPFALDWIEQGQNPGDLLGQAIDRLIPGVTKMSGRPMREFLQSYLVDGRHVFDWGFWNLIARGMSHEAYELARITSGYDTPMQNWNAYDTISLNFDLAPNVTFNAVVPGYQAVPLTVAGLFEDAGGRIALGHELNSFDQEADGTVVLTFANADPVRARSLILAMPRRSLELLDQTGPVLGPEQAQAVRPLIESVTPIPLFKSAIAYPFPWWESVGVTEGRTVTDLPIRQLYYWATAQPTESDPDNRKSVLLATYDDGENVTFWSGFSDPSHPLGLFETRPDAHTEKHPGNQSWNDYKPTFALVEEIDRQLNEIHGTRYAPEPYAAAYMDWGIDPFGGGVNFWNVHARSWEVIERMVQPVADVPVYVCGEAYSNGQGWVEGALETAELVLAKLGLQPPEWVTAS